jgi:hypothetical protein
MLFLGPIAHFRDRITVIAVRKFAHLSFLKQIFARGSFQHIEELPCKLPSGETTPRVASGGGETPWRTSGRAPRSVCRMLGDSTVGQKLVGRGNFGGSS